MISSEVERTLVKSPPELWTELSNPDALARHLGEFGEIRITRIEPEHEVEWEAGDTAGTVRIKPSGWGTKVTLTASREITASEPPAAAEPAPESVPDPVVDKAIELEPEPTPALAPEPKPTVLADAMVEPAPAPAEPHLDAELSRSFFSRLFGSRRRRKAAETPRKAMQEVSELVPPHAKTFDAGLQWTQPAPERPDPFAAVREALSPETITAADLFSMSSTVEARALDKREIQIETQPDEAADISADLKAAEEVAAEEVTAVLTSVLDRLGAAHHRPFSRA
ncbi:MAG TPA: hypothetical protein VN892_12345 [Solirubrobacteraceae bacterium]|nr:hypothetical protein [Solirubrobacteraceae bacterium]